MLIGSDFEWYSKTEQPHNSKSYQLATILDSYVLVMFLIMVESCRYVPDHSNLIIYFTDKSLRC